MTRRKYGTNLALMTHFRISEAATLLGVSDDTVRRWVDAGKLPMVKDQSGRMAIPGVDLAAFARNEHEELPGKTSARNRFEGVVTRVEISGVVGLVELQSGPHRITSVITSDAITELGIQVGSRASASVKATQVVLERG